MFSRCFLLFLTFFIVISCSTTPGVKEKKITSTTIEELSTEKISLPGIITQAGLCQWQDKKLHDMVSNTIRIIPTELMDGFFIAKIRKC